MVSMAPARETASGEGQAKCARSRVLGSERGSRRIIGGGRLFDEEHAWSTREPAAAAPPLPPGLLHGLPSPPGLR
jgi:hypothetical protein